MTVTHPPTTAEAAPSTRTAVYVALCIVGTILPMTQFIPFLGDHGLDLGELWDQMVATRISTAVTWDLTVSLLTLWAFMALERRISGAQAGLVILANFLVGLSLGFPLYLLLRERNARPSAARA